MIPPSISACGHAPRRRPAFFLILAAACGFLFPVKAPAAGHVHASPVPDAEAASKDFAVSAEGVALPVYLAKVAPADDKERWLAMDDKAHSGDHADHASFTPFDMDGPVTVVITCPQAVTSVRVLPTSYGIHPTVEGQRITIPLATPRNLTVEVNGDWIHSLHLFASPVEADAPRQGSPNVLYYGPGVHELDKSLEVGSGKTLYLANGAILRVVGDDGGPAIRLVGDHVSLRGRGVIDGSRCTSHGRNLLYVKGRDIKIDGVILHDSPGWNVPMRECDRVTVTNFKILGCRANSDGIDVCDSRDVSIDGCFLRTLDDLVVVKSHPGLGGVHRILVKNCVLWNQCAHALSVGAELRDVVDDVLFTDCDVIHDIGREWTLRVYQCDSGLVSNVRFENIRIEQARRLFSVWIGQAIWSRDATRGNVRNVLFRNIRAVSPVSPPAELKGFDAGHDIEGVTFQGVFVNNQLLTLSGVKPNEFVKGVVVKP